MAAFTSTPKTVFIVGAGASKEVGLPIGSELKRSIASALDIQVERGYPHLISGDHDIYAALRLMADRDPRQMDLLRSFQSACWHIRDAMPQAISIDNFIDVHSEDKQIELCGKLAIVRTILEAEAKSALFVDQLQSRRQLEYEGLEKTWFNGFFQRLTENCKPSGLVERLNSVVLIIFNYDRCIEQYLYYALQNFYPSLNASDVVSLLLNIEIYHPYGTVGSIPWLRKNDAIEYGATPNPEQLLSLTSQIKTFTEGTDESSSNVTAIRSHIKKADRLVFLGFAFHRLNLDLLSPHTRGVVEPVGRSVFATALNISHSDIEAIRDQLAVRRVLSTGHAQIRNDLTCNQLFREYSFRLSFT